MDGITHENNQERQRKKLPLFSCTKISKYFFYPLMIPIFCVAYNFVRDKYVEYTHKYDEIKFYLSKIAFISRILGGSLYFVYKNDREENQIKSSKGKIPSSLIFNDIEKNKFIKALKIISIISLFELFILEFDFLTIEYTKLDVRLFYLFFIVLLSYKIFGTRIFLHQKISLAFSGLGLIIVFISTIIANKNNEHFNFYINLIAIISSIFYALLILCHKYIMEELFISPLLLLFISGLINFFVEFIFNICYNLIMKENLENIFINIIYLINSEDWKICIIFLILLILIGIFYFILVKLTLFHFSPALLIITDLLAPLIQLFLPSIDKGNDIEFKYKVLSVIGYSISIIAAIFYNELIICNFYGLNENTANNIKERSESENSKILLGESKYDDELNCSAYEDEKEKIDENKEVNQ